MKNYTDSQLHVCSLLRIKKKKSWHNHYYKSNLYFTRKCTCKPSLPTATDLIVSQNCYHYVYALLLSAVRCLRHVSVRMTGVRDCLNCEFVISDQLYMQGRDRPGANRGGGRGGTRSRSTLFTQNVPCAAPSL